MIRNNIGFMMKKMKGFFFLVFILIFSLAPFTKGYAQIPTDLSKYKSDQFSDMQLIQMVKKAQSAGLSESDVIQQLQQRLLRNKQAKHSESRRPRKNRS